MPIYSLYNPRRPKPPAQMPSMLQDQQRLSQQSPTVASPPGAAQQVGMPQQRPRPAQKPGQYQPGPKPAWGQPQGAATPDARQSAGTMQTQMQAPPQPRPPRAPMPRPGEYQPGAGIAGPVQTTIRDPGMMQGAQPMPTDTTQTWDFHDSARESADRVLTTEELVEEFIRDQLEGGVRDTSEEEALIRELMESKQGSEQTALMARMAAGGFGTSGALGALSGDINRRAAREAADAILNTRRDARDEFMDNARTAIDAEFRDRGADLDDFVKKEALKALQAELGLEEGEDPLPQLTDFDSREEYDTHMRRRYGKTAPVGEFDPGGNMFNPITIPADPNLIQALGLKPSAAPGLLEDAHGNLYKPG